MLNMINTSRLVNSLLTEKYEINGYAVPTSTNKIYDIIKFLDNSCNIMFTICHLKEKATCKLIEQQANLILIQTCDIPG